MRALLLPLRTRGFGRLVTTYALNELADWLATIALSVLVYDATNDALATAALFLASKFLPGFVVPALAARFDGLAVRRLLASLYVVEAAALLGLALVAGAFALPVILVLSLVAGTMAAAGRATTRSATVALLEPHGSLREGNALINICFSAMNAAGPAVAGLLVAAMDPAPVLAVAAAVFAAQAVVVGTAEGLPRPGRNDAESWWTRLREGADYIRGAARLRTLIVGQAVVLLLLTMVTPIEVIYAKETLDAGDAGFGLLLTAWGVGMVLGSWMFAQQRQRAVRSLIVLSTVTMAMGYVGMAVAPSLAVACVASALGGLGNGVQWIAVVTAIQEETADAFQARVSGFLEAVLAAAPGIGFMTGGLLTALLNPRAAFAAAGIGVLAVLALGAAVLAQSRTPAPESVG